MAATNALARSEIPVQSGTNCETDVETPPTRITPERRRRPTLDELLRMPLEESGEYLRRAAEEAADEYINDPSVTEFTCLDGEDFVDDP